MSPKRYIPNDRWSQKAASEGFRARSVYKLEELDVRYKLFTPGMRVLDIGAAPGSWLQYIATRIGAHGRALGIDLKPISPIGPNVVTAVCDLRDHHAVSGLLDEHHLKECDIVVSDIAPNTSGIRDVDQWRSIELSLLAIELAETVLKRGGTLVLKVFRGRSFDEFYANLKPLFQTLKIVSVNATRDRSIEVYVVCFKKQHPSSLFTSSVIEPCENANTKEDNDNFKDGLKSADTIHKIA